VAKFDQGRSMNDRLYQLNKLEEGILIAMHHQEVQKNNKIMARPSFKEKGHKKWRSGFVI
jgi:hypothetical protein